LKPSGALMPGLVGPAVVCCELTHFTFEPYGFVYGAPPWPDPRRPATAPAVMPAPSQKNATGAVTFGMAIAERLPVSRMLPKNVPSCFG
jgi:hypothetical protein